jgi:hypothetical protein
MMDGCFNRSVLSVLWFEVGDTYCSVVLQSNERLDWVSGLFGFI